MQRENSKKNHDDYLFRMHEKRQNKISRQIKTLVIALKGWI